MNIVDDLMEVNNGSLNDKEKTKTIRQEISAASKQFKEKYPIFKHQNAIGLSLHILSTLCIFSASFL